MFNGSFVIRKKDGIAYAQMRFIIERKISTCHRLVHAYVLLKYSVTRFYSGSIRENAFYLLLFFCKKIMWATSDY